MQADNGVARRLDTVFEAPEPFSGALVDHFRSPWSVSLIIYAPATATAGENGPATVRAVGEGGWVVVSGKEDGSVSVERCGFNDTLFLELTSILLWGQLKIDYASVAASSSAVGCFNTVGEEPYQQAIEAILGGIDRARVPGSARTNAEAAAALARLADAHVSQHGHLSVLAPEAHARHGGERLEVLFPAGHAPAVAKALEQARLALSG